MRPNFLPMKFEHEQDSHKVSGLYDDSDGSILIAKNLGKYEAECVYYHERQHRKCHQEKCKCWGKSTNYLAELHAYKAELRDVIRANDRRLTKAYFKQITAAIAIYEADPKYYRDNYKALKRVMGTKEFKDFVKQVKESD